MMISSIIIIIIVVGILAIICTVLVLLEPQYFGTARVPRRGSVSLTEPGALGPAQRHIEGPPAGPPPHPRGQKPLMRGVQSWLSSGWAVWYGVVWYMARYSRLSFNDCQHHCPMYS